MTTLKRWIVKDLSNDTYLTRRDWSPLIGEAYQYSCEDYARAALQIRLDEHVHAHERFGAAFDIMPIYVPKVNHVNGTPYEQLTKKQES